jgi:hypothetical protein
MRGRTYQKAAGRRGPRSGAIEPGRAPQGWSPGRAALALVAAVAAACSSHHRVSPWGERGGVPLDALAARPDLAARLAAIDAETAEAGLALASEHEAELPRGGGPVVVRGYEGRNALGRLVHAVRVATSRGVVLAVGPPDPQSALPAAPRVPWPGEAARPGGSWSASLATTDAASRPLLDVNHDGALDLLLRDQDGVLAIVSLEPMGSSRLAIAMTVAPDRLEDVDGDGRLDLVGTVPVPRGDAIAPRLDDVGTWDGAGYASTTAAARAFHAARADELAEDGAGTGGGSPAPPPEPPEARLRRAIERAFHLALAGGGSGDIVRVLDREPVPPSLRASFERWAALVTRVAEVARPRPPSPPH